MSEPPLDREARRRLAVLRHVVEVTGNVAATCRYYGVSRQAYYGWLRRFEAEGVDGLRDRSKRPKTSPNATHVDVVVVVGKIIHLRQHYHFGPGKIQMYFNRYHDVKISQSGVWRILKRLDMNRLPASQRYKRHDRTRLRVLRIYPQNNQKTAIQFIDYVAQRLPFTIETIQTDNGAEFQSSFHWHVLDKGMQHVYIKPRTPRLNGKVERSHRIDAEEFYRLLDGVVIDDAKVFNDKLQE